MAITLDPGDMIVRPPLASCLESLFEIERGYGMRDALESLSVASLCEVVVGAACSA